MGPRHLLSSRIDRQPRTARGCLPVRNSRFHLRHADFDIVASNHSEAAGRAGTEVRRNPRWLLAHYASRASAIIETFIFWNVNRRIRQRRYTFGPEAFD